MAMTPDTKSASASRNSSPGLRVPSSATDSHRGSWFQRRASQLRRSTIHTPERSEKADGHDVFSADAPRTVPTPAVAVGEPTLEMAAHARGTDWSPGTAIGVSLLQGSANSSPDTMRRRASTDGALAPPFTTPQATSKLNRSHTMSTRSRSGTPASPDEPVAHPPIAGMYDACAPVASWIGY